GHRLDAVFGDSPARFDLRTHKRDGTRRWTNERDSCILARLCEGRVLRQEAVTRMNCIRMAALRRIDDFFNDQITLSRWRRADRISLVGHPHMKCSSIGFGINSDGGASQFVTRTDHAHGNFTAIRDEDFLKTLQGSALDRNQGACVWLFGSYGLRDTVWQ